jgi:hypothetical protein
MERIALTQDWSLRRLIGRLLAIVGVLVLAGTAYVFAEGWLAMQRQAACEHGCHHARPEWASCWIDCPYYQDWLDGN